MATYLGKIQLLEHSSADWAINDAILLKGQVGFANASATLPVMKVGDGVRPWSALTNLVGGGSGGVLDDPTALIGLTPIVGVAATGMRSDAAPALDQSIAPVWTGVHRFSGTLAAGLFPAPLNGIEIALGNDGHPSIYFGNAGAPADAKNWSLVTSHGAMVVVTYDDLGGTPKSVVQFQRSGNVLTRLEFGNTDNPAYNFGGTGLMTFDGQLVLGASAPVAVGNVMRVQEFGLTLASSGHSMVKGGNDANGVILALGKTRSAAYDGAAPVVLDDVLGVLTFYGADGTSLNTSAGGIYARVAGAVSAGVVPGELHFYTTQVGGGAVDRFRIASFGGLGIGSSGAYGTAGQSFLSGGGAAPPTWGNPALTAVNFADPSSPVGMGVIPGSALTAMRSDAAPPINPAIIPTWTGAHAFTATGSQITLTNPGGARLVMSDTDAAVGAKNASLRFIDGEVQIVSETDGYATAYLGFAVDRYGAWKASGNVGIAGQVLSSQGIGLPAIWRHSGTIEAHLIFSTSTLGNDPGPTAFGMNSSTYSAVTQLTYDTQDTSGYNLSTILELLAVGNRIYIQQDNDITRAVVYQVSGAPTDQSGWWRVPVSFVRTNQFNTLFQNAAACTHAFILSSAGSSASGADPTATIGLTVVNGAATTFMRSDAAPPLSQAIVPTWSGAHTFNGAVNLAGLLLASGAEGVSGQVLASQGAGLPAVWRTSSGGSIELGYNFSTSVGTANPGSQKLSLNSAVYSAVTVAVFNSLAMTNFDANTILSLLRPGNRIYIQQRNDATKAVVYEVTAPATNQTGYWTVPVTHINSLSATMFAANADLNAVFILSTSASSGANPTATVGLAAVNGSASTWMRSDAAPPLDQAIAPTWSGAHVFSSSIVVGAPAGGAQGAGTINATGLYVNGVAVGSGGAAVANPTSTIGLSTVNGSAATAMRSDGAPALSQAIAPTWTAAHRFTAGATATSGPIELVSAQPGIWWKETDAGADNQVWLNYLAGGINTFQIQNDAGSNSRDWLRVTRSSLAIASLVFGNVYDTPTYSFLGTGTLTVGGSISAGTLVSATDGAVIVKIQGINSTTSGMVGTQSNHRLEFRTNNTIRGYVDADGSAFTYMGIVQANTNFRSDGGLASVTGSLLLKPNTGAMTYGTYYVEGAVGAYHGLMVRDTVLNPGLMSNGTAAGIYLQGESKWLLYRSSSTIAASGYTLETIGLYTTGVSGGNLGAGTINAGGIYVNGVAVTTGAHPSVPTGANPSASVGLSASNGSAGTWMRSDAAPALSVSISPTWTGTHTFSNAVTAPSFTSTSGRDIKRETGTPPKPASILARLRPILYRLLAGDDREQLGLIAEEVHEVCPQLSDGKTVSYDRLAILLLAAWQDEHAGQVA